MKRLNYLFLILITTAILVCVMVAFSSCSKGLYNTEWAAGHRMRCGSGVGK